MLINSKIHFAVQ
ncbi:hypothetical protein Patl1_07193 [Pistacia atlantica]|uniref:Uncharacterized protein n=1 Tax=Pistacia atlantica TaxID=434234 RepID=A0ACC1AHR9_9ROSI|nr:hypothetical protein Patl1_07193 [Pistacia atlantica]